MITAAIFVMLALGAAFAAWVLLRSPNIEENTSKGRWIVANDLQPMATGEKEEPVRGLGEEDGESIPTKTSQ